MTENPTDPIDTIDPIDVPLVEAATVLLLRDGRNPDGTDGIEVLMLRRNSKIAFGGMWVFPGGRVDDGDRTSDDPVDAARAAAIRESHEEAGLHVSGHEMHTWSHWEPPLAPAMARRGPIRRFSTWFFATHAPEGEVNIDDGEIKEHVWLTPSTAFARHRAQEIELAPPTWITLQQLAVHDRSADALAWAAATEPRRFHTRPLGRDPLTIGWVGDAGFESSDGSTPGPRNRLEMHDSGWVWLDHD